MVWSVCDSRASAKAGKGVLICALDGVVRAHQHHQRVGL